MAPFIKGISDHVETVLSILRIAPPCGHIKVIHFTVGSPPVFPQMPLSNSLVMLLMIVPNAYIVYWLFDVFLSGVVLEAGKDVTFNPEDDDFEHQLDLRMVHRHSAAAVQIPVWKTV